MYVVSAPTNSDDYIIPLLDERFVPVHQDVSTSELYTLLESHVRPLAQAQTCVVSLVGGPGSGKSTISSGLIGHLSGAGLTVDCISTDDYNIGDRAWRREYFEGDTVRDPLGKWDFAYMNTKIEQIKHNKDPHARIKVPTYDPASGVAIAASEANYAHQIGPVDVLIVEGDMFKVEHSDLAIYLHVSDDQRLKNRINRDLRERNGGNMEAVAANFNLRQHNQFFPYTLPAVNSAMMIIWAKPSDADWRYDVYIHQEA